MKEGDVYNEWTVLKYKNRHCVYVRCSCGFEDIRRADHLEKGRTKCCKSCSAKRTAKEHGVPITPKQSIGDLGKVYYSSLKCGAKKRHLEWSVDQEYLWSIFCGKCALTGRVINLSDKLTNNNCDYESFTASLDRIDSRVGYIKGNVQWVHKDINRFKNNYSEEELLQMCTEIINHANQQPSLGNDIEVPKKVQRLGDEESNQ